jgi:hypothetical protein
MDAAAISGLLPAARPDEDGTGSDPEPMTEPTEETP